MATVQQRIVAALLSFRLSPKSFSAHAARAIHSFIHSFIHATSPHLAHHIIAWPGLVLPCLALPCLPSPLLIRTLLPLAALQTTTTTLILMSSSSSIFFYSYLALNPFSFEACVVIVVVFFL
jgi:hypothetical protein